MKKLFALALSLVLALSLAAPAVAADDLDLGVIGGPDGPTAISVELPDDMDLINLDPDDLPSPYLPWEEEPTEPQPLTLWVDGEVTDVELTAENGVTYANAAALREVLGEATVSPALSGNVPVRDLAEKTGWDVVWYPGNDYKGPQVCLWNRGAYMDGAQDLQPAMDFLSGYMALSKAQLYPEKAQRTTQNLTVNLTRFSTLDGDEDYQLTFTAETVAKDGVVDMTVSVSWDQLLKLLKGYDVDLQALGEATGISLKDAVGMNKVEMLMDYNEGVMAIKAPILALIADDETYGDWQTTDFDPSLLDTDSLSTSLFYNDLLGNCGFMGADYAQGQYESTMGALTAFFGSDHFTTVGGRSTYHLTTAQVNQALSGLAELEEPGSFFKSFDVKVSFTTGGSAEVSVDVRPDVKGMVKALSSDWDASQLFTSIFGNILADFQLTGTSTWNGKSGSGNLLLHMDNSGIIKTHTTAAMNVTGSEPRNPADITE